MSFQYALHETIATDGYWQFPSWQAALDEGDAVWAGGQQTVTNPEGVRTTARAKLAQLVVAEEVRQTYKDAMRFGYIAEELQPGTQATLQDDDDAVLRIVTERRLQCDTPLEKQMRIFINTPDYFNSLGTEMLESPMSDISRVITQVPTVETVASDRLPYMYVERAAHFFRPAFRKLVGKTVSDLRRAPNLGTSIRGVDYVGRIRTSQDSGYQVDKKILQATVITPSGVRNKANESSKGGMRALFFRPQII